MQAGPLEREGPGFIALHKLFDEINEDVEEYVDLLAERVVQLGGIAEGTVGSSRADRPHRLSARISTGSEHVAALSDALAAFGRTARIGIEEMNELEDADSADILTEISRGGQVALVRRGPHPRGERVQRLMSLERPLRG